MKLPLTASLPILHAAFTTRRPRWIGSSAQYHSAQRAVIFASPSGIILREEYLWRQAAASGGRNFANEMRDYRGIIVIRPNAWSAHAQTVGRSMRRGAHNNLRWRSLMLAHRPPDHPPRYTFTGAPAPHLHSSSCVFRRVLSARSVTTVLYYIHIYSSKWQKEI